jgi:hypothetical protein
MPSSVVTGKHATALVLHELVQVRGLRRFAGCGTYARLFSPLFPDASWTGVDIWPPYFREYALQDWYDPLLVADARYVDFAKLPAFDIALFGDMLEHMTRQESAACVDSALSHAAYALFSIPLGYSPQEEEPGGNPWQEHVAEGWTVERLVENFPALLAVMANRGMAIGVLSKRPEERAAFEKLFKNIPGFLASAENELAAVPLLVDFTDESQCEAIVRSLRGVVDRYCLYAGKSGR